MQQLSAENLQFLARLSKSPEGHLLLDVLRAELAAVDVKLRKASGEELLRTQGRAQALDELVDAITNAKNKLNPPRPTPPGTALQALRALG